MEVLRHPIATPYSRARSYLLWKRREANHDTGSLQEETIKFSTSHGLIRVCNDSASLPSLQSNPFPLTFLCFCNSSSLEAHTKPPYTLTLKSNGCIIFIAALSESRILITSKYSIGPIQGASERHAQAGERWLRQHLEQVGKTADQLSKVLWERNWTAVAEVSHPILIRCSPFHNPRLCDGSFEEHVLPYSAEKTDLRLHGLNDCSGDFKTQPTVVVDEFARERGFKRRRVPVLLRFVVLFKVKFDEPYMMYREWREITKSLLSKGENANLPKNKMARPETTKVYVAWVKGEIKRNPDLFEGYSKGHGIVATRDRFLEWLEGGATGKKKPKTEKEATHPPGKEFGKTIIMPIAVAGVGTSHSRSTWWRTLTSNSKAKPLSQWL